MIVRLKERINYGFAIISKLLEECHTRDKVLAENALDTHLGKARALIVPQPVHAALNEFFQCLEEPFE